MTDVAPSPMTTFLFDLPEFCFAVASQANRVEQNQFWLIYFPTSREYMLTSNIIISDIKEKTDGSIIMSGLL